MPWHISVWDEPPIIETHYSGVMTPAEVTEAAWQTIAVARCQGITRLLGNCATLEGGHSIADLYFLADSLVSGGNATQFKEAVLLPKHPATQGLAWFWENTCRNRGIQVRVFDDRQSAVDWLLE